MNIYGHLKNAGELGYSRQEIVGYRQEFITNRLMDLQQDYEFMFSNLSGYCELFDELLLQELAENIRERNKLKREAKTIKRINMPQTGITDEEVENARNAPITRVVDFSHGKVKAFCHEDNNPSMFHATRTNKAICPVCDRKFDAIRVLMERDGFSFTDAVKELQ